MKPSDFIKQTVGTILYVYYTYVKYFTLRPRDLDDLVDGLLYIDTQQFLRDKELEHSKTNVK